MPSGTVLVIEDNSLQRDGLATILRREGFRVLTAKDGNEALNKLSSHPIPDLVLLDMLIPSGYDDGWWFLKQRQHIPELSAVPVIIVTSLSVASKEWAASLDAAGVIRKPFEVETLLAEIRHCLSYQDVQGT
jgi:CheY-like chemotaxis protein